MDDLEPGRRRPAEEYLLYALMFLLICVGVSFVGFEVVAVSLDAAPAAESAPALPSLTAPPKDEATASALVPVSTLQPVGAALPALASPTTASSAAAAASGTLPPGTTPRATSTPTATLVKIPAGVYRVQPGDTLLGIAYRAGLTLDDLLAANPRITNPNKLALNQSVTIPSGGQAPVGVPPQAITPVVVEVNGGRITYPQMGAIGGYVPYGAMSVSDARVTQGKKYSAGSFEYLHGVYKVPFPLPYIDKSVVALPAPVAPDTCPLTGLPLASGDILRRRPLNVRIDNAPQARPQSGLGNADIIFETLAEGGITRFSAMFLCSAGSVDIGPVRSARLIDLQLSPMFKAILVHVGASQPVLDMIWSSEIGEADFDPVFRNTFGFGRVTWRPAPHNVYSSIGSLWSVAGAKGLAGPVDLQGLAFNPLPPGGGRPGTRAQVPYNSAVSDVGYVYSDGLYTKLIGGQPHTDANSKQPLRFANVILVFAQATYTDALEDGISSRSLHFNIQGAGRALILRDGQVFDAIWRHEGRNILLHFTDPQGRIIPLKPGASMINIVPLELGVSVE